MATNCKYHCKKGKIYLESTKTLVDCPDCRDIKKVLEKTDASGITYYDKLFIPEAYKSTGVIGKELFATSTVANSFTQASIAEVANMLERINQDIYLGRVTQVSLYLFVGNNVDIRQFVYGSQKMALEKGLGVSPFISLNTLYGIQKVIDYNFRDLPDDEVLAKGRSLPLDTLSALDGMRFIEKTKVTYFDFINADLCFIDATSATTAKGWTALADLLSERSRNNLPTYVIGYWQTSNQILYNSGLNFLIGSINASRLDRLNTFELKLKKNSKSDEETSVGITKVPNFSTTKASVTAGVSLADFMGS